MQFRVPQFIDIEDKIFGPFTFKQFAYILGAGGFGFILWSLIPIKIIAIIFIVPVSGFFLALAFFKVNDRPFVEVVENFLKYHSNNKIYVWQQSMPKEITKDPISSKIQSANESVSKNILLPKSKESRLHEISFGLDVLDKDKIEGEEEKM